MAVGELWETATHAITAYTGLSPAAFFTVVALGGAVYHVVSGFFQPPPPPARNREVELEAMEPLPPPVQLGEISEEELRVFDGSDPKKPLLMAIKAQIYDVTQSRMFYGPGGPYALFAGKDASRALAKMSFEQKDLTGDISGLGPFEIEALQDWEYKFMSKYMKVGTIKQSVPVTEDSSEATAETTAAEPVGKAAGTEVDPKEVGAETTTEVESEQTVEAKDVAPAEHKEVESKEAESKETPTAEPEQTVEAKDVAPADHKEMESKEAAGERDEGIKG